MRRVELAPNETTEVRDLLSAIGQGDGLPEGIRVNAVYWADAVGNGMERRDLQRVAWLLLKTSENGTVPIGYRRSARYWAAYLQARI
jgi:hypothetical protein